MRTSINEPPKGIGLDTPLTCKALAQALGPRREGKLEGHITKTETVREWMLRGRRGVILKNRVEGFRRVTTWRWYVEWCEKVTARWDEDRERRRDAVRGTQAIEA